MKGSTGVVGQYFSWVGAVGFVTQTFTFSLSSFPNPCLTTPKRPSGVPAGRTGFTALAVAAVGTSGGARKHVGAGHLSWPWAGRNVISERDASACANRLRKTLLGWGRGICPEVAVRRKATLVQGAPSLYNLLVSF